MNKICLISRKFDANSGSGEWVYAAKLKDELKKRGYFINIIEQKKSGSKEKRYTKFFHDWIKIPFLCIYYYIFKKIKTFHFLSENQGLVIPILNMLGANTIVTFYDLMRIWGGKETSDKRYFKFIYYMASKAKKIHCISSETKRDLLNFFNTNSKIKIIPVNCREFYPLTKNKIKNIIGYIGALTIRKRPEKFLEIAKEISNQKLNYNIILWGKGEEKMKLEKKYPFLKLKGFALEKDLNKIYNSFDFFVFPTSYEGLGLPIIEASMCGVPSFIYADAKIPDEIKDLCIICKDSKELIKKIDNLKKNKLKYFNLKKGLIKKSKNFSFKQNIKELVSFYDVENGKERKEKNHKNKF